MSYKTGIGGQGARRHEASGMRRLGRPVIARLRCRHPSVELSAHDEHCLNTWDGSPDACGSCERLGRPLVFVLCFGETVTA